MNQPNQHKSVSKGVILAGGMGTRLYPVTYEIPKPLLPVKRKPIVNYLVDLFQEQGIKNIALLINKGFREEFDWWKKRYYPKKKIEFFEEKKPLGTFGGIWFLKDWISNSPFFLTNGDELKKINLKKMIEFHNQRQVIGSIALVRVADPENYGVVISKNGFIQKFLEKPKKPPTNYVSSGLYLLNPEIFQYHSGPRFSMIETDIFPKLVREKKLAGYKFKGNWMDCGNFSRWEKAIHHWK